jgi:hypothetical protein
LHDCACLKWLVYRSDCLLPTFYRRVNSIFPLLHPLAIVLVYRFAELSVPVLC